MSDDLFETELEAMFAATPEAPDADLFTAAVERRLASQTRVRSLTLAVTGLAGAAVALPRLMSLTGDARQAAASGVSSASTSVNAGLAQAADLMHSIPMGQTGLWLGLGFVGLMAVSLTRVVREA